MLPHHMRGLTKRAVARGVRTQWRSSSVYPDNGDHERQRDAAGVMLQGRVQPPCNRDFEHRVRAASWPWYAR
eukprot:1270106-Lingulodinium_polyedra.AAC.1